MAVAGLLGASTAARAGDVQFGPRFSISDDADLGVGADVRWAFLARRPPPRAHARPSTTSFPRTTRREDLDDALRRLRGPAAARIRAAARRPPPRHRGRVLGGQPQPDLGLHHRARGDPLRRAGRQLRPRRHVRLRVRLRRAATSGPTCWPGSASTAASTWKRSRKRAAASCSCSPSGCGSRQRPSVAQVRGRGARAVEVAFPQVAARLRHRHPAQARGARSGSGTAIRPLAMSAKDQTAGQRRHRAHHHRDHPQSRGRASPRLRRTGTPPPSRRSTTSRGWSRTRRSAGRR